MRIAIIGALLFCACGTWSNEDIEFLYAVPQRNELKAQLASSSTGQPLLAGDPSKTYDNTKAASDGFNKAIDDVLKGLDFIRTIPPTKREENARIWGPYPDQNNKGFDVQVEIHRESATLYTWAIKMRPRLGEFFTVAGGSFKPTKTTLRKGQGSFFFDAKTAHAGLGTMADPDAGEPDRIDFGYATDGDPLIVNIDFQFAADKSLAYAYNGYADKSAILNYLLKQPADPNASKVSATAGWDTTTAGRIDYVILEGKWATATGIECWSDSHTVDYAKGYDDAGMFEVGDKTKCIAYPELQPLP